MLVYLHIRDLAVVAGLELGFQSGLTVLTGETGAGKSILLTALGLALGDRADPGYIRPGAQRAEISLSFELSDSPGARSWLEERELADGETCLVRRVIAADGRSRAFVNGSPVTLQALQELGQGLVEIHGQHAHVQLTKASEQRRLLDVAAGTSEQASRLEDLYRRWRTVSDGLKQLTTQAASRAARLELLQFQVDELEQHDIGALDYAALVEDHTRQAHVDRILEVGQQQLDRLYEDEAHSVNACLAQATHALSDLMRVAPEFSEPMNLLQEAQMQVKEASLQLRRELERQESDPAALGLLEQRLAEVHRLARKHHVRPEELPHHWRSLKVELSELEASAGNTESLSLELDALTADYRQQAEALSTARRAAACMLQQRISQTIRELGMPQGELLVEVRTASDRDPMSGGFDTVEFLVSANPGIPPRPLSRVASGGELSRISLAIQVVATAANRVATLIFDEVDSGIGGGIAEVVGQKLRILGMDRQVFCVTHLPQVAAQGHHHLLVEKQSQDGVTQTGVTAMEGPERIPEIARMLGGMLITDQTLAHAEEMLRLASGNAAV